MKFFLVISWRYEWATTGIMDVRAIEDEDEAHRIARQYNAVIVEVNAADDKVYVDTHDYEFRDENQESAPGVWVDIPTYTRGLAWGPAPSPVVRVGKDIKRKEYEEMVHGD